MVLFRMKGVPVKIGWSWLVIVALVFASLWSSVFPGSDPGLAPGSYLLMAGVGTMLFFVSILLHELSHTWWSLREGVRVRDITLWLFGGVSRADEPIPAPGAELRVVLAGPLASAVLAVLFWRLAAGGWGLGLSAAWVAVPAYLARINALLLAFNLVPALPLDGGRLLHALLWWRSGDEAGARIHAARVGKVFAGTLLVVGVVSIGGAGAPGGAWFVILGWFLWQAVKAEDLGARTTRALTGLRVRDVMTPAAVTLDAGSTLEQLGDLVSHAPSHPAYPVTEDGRYVGLLVLRRAGAVPLADRARVRVGDVMLTGADVPAVHEDDDVTKVAATLDRAPGRAIVLGGALGHDLVGVVSTSDLQRVLAASQRRRGGRLARGSVP